jgi:hypothetical protein
MSGIDVLIAAVLGVLFGWRVKPGTRLLRAVKRRRAKHG